MIEECTIGVLSKESGVNLETIRYYEKIHGASVHKHGFWCAMRERMEDLISLSDDGQS